MGDPVAAGRGALTEPALLRSVPHPSTAAYERAGHAVVKETQAMQFKRSHAKRSAPVGRHLVQVVTGKVVTGKVVTGKVVTGLCLAACLALAGAPAAFAQSPAVGSVAKSGTGAAKVASPKTTPLDINSASLAELDALKGIGEKRAADIVKGRPYKGKDDLVQKKIIPQGVYDGIKDQIIAKQK